MASLLVRVRLDWSGPGHCEVGVSRPCRVCGRPCEKRCAEDEIARELLGAGLARIADERVPAAARTLGVAR